MNITPISCFKNPKSQINFKNNQKENSPEIVSNPDGSTTYSFKNKDVKIVATVAVGVALLGLIAITKNKKNAVNIIENIVPTNKKNSPNISGNAITEGESKCKNIVDDIIITNKNKIKNLLAKFTHDDFDANKNFKVNLHMHSTMSDGKMPPLEVLRQINERAKKLPNGEKFTFSLTDHDNIEGVKIIADEIKKHPEKYSRLNFIPGIEMSAKYHNPTLSDNPVEFDFLIYGFDINNKPLIKQIEKRQEYLRKHTQEFFNELNAFSKSDLSVEKMQKEAHNPHLKHIASNGYLKALVEYTEDYCLENRFDTRGQIENLIQKHFGNARYAFDANIELLDAVKLSKDANAFCSIAHPGKFNFNHANLRCEGVNLSDDIISKFLNAGGDGIESHYMAYHDNNKNWWERIRDSFKRLGLEYSRTGGYDCHGKTIFTKH